MDSDSLKDTSVPLCFVCLLHLANEHNLRLTQSSLHDLQVQQQKGNDKVQKTVNKETEKDDEGETTEDLQQD